LPTIDIAVKDGRLVGVRGRATDMVNHGRLDPKDRASLATRRRRPYGVSCSGYGCFATEGGAMTDTETGQVTGTKDKDYNIIWFTEACLSNALRLETYIKDADREGDKELAEFFRRAQTESRKGAEQGKQLLASRIAASS
jgi:hypothetical protein